jgi:hypothetical protein
MAISYSSDSNDDNHRLEISFPANQGYEVCNGVKEPVRGLAMVFADPDDAFAANQALEEQQTASRETERNERDDQQPPTGNKRSIALINMSPPQAEPESKRSLLQPSTAIQVPSTPHTQPTSPLRKKSKLQMIARESPDFGSETESEIDDLEHVQSQQSLTQRLRSSQAVKADDVASNAFNKRVDDRVGATKLIAKATAGAISRTKPKASATAHLPTASQKAKSNSKTHPLAESSTNTRISAKAGATATSDSIKAPSRATATPAAAPSEQPRRSSPPKPRSLNIPNPLTLSAKRYPGGPMARLAGSQAQTKSDKPESQPSSKEGLKRKAPAPKSSQKPTQKTKADTDWEKDLQDESQFNLPDDQDSDEEPSKKRRKVAKKPAAKAAAPKTTGRTVLPKSKAESQKPRGKAKTTAKPKSESQPTIAATRARRAAPKSSKNVQDSTSELDDDKISDEEAVPSSSLRGAKSSKASNAKASASKSADETIVVQNASTSKSQTVINDIDKNQEKEVTTVEPKPPTRKLGLSQKTRQRLSLSEGNELGNGDKVETRTEAFAQDGLEDDAMDIDEVQDSYPLDEATKSRAVAPSDESFEMILTTHTRPETSKATGGSDKENLPPPPRTPFGNKKQFVANVNHHKDSAKKNAVLSSDAAGSAKKTAATKKPQKPAEIAETQQIPPLPSPAKQDTQTKNARPVDGGKPQTFEVVSSAKVRATKPWSPEKVIHIPSDDADSEQATNDETAIANAKASERPSKSSSEASVTAESRETAREQPPEKDTVDVDDDGVVDANDDVPVDNGSRKDQEDQAALPSKVVLNVGAVSPTKSTSLTKKSEQTPTARFSRLEPTTHREDASLVESVSPPKEHHESQAEAPIITNPDAPRKTTSPPESKTDTHSGRLPGALTTKSTASHNNQISFRTPQHQKVTTKEELVSEMKNKKPIVVGFGPSGPLNQGRSPPSPPKQAQPPREESKHHRAKKHADTTMLTSEATPSRAPDSNDSKIGFINDKAGDALSESPAAQAEEDNYAIADDGIASNADKVAEPEAITVDATTFTANEISNLESPALPETLTAQAVASTSSLHVDDAHVPEQAPESERDEGPEDGSRPPIEPESDDNHESDLPDRDSASESESVDEDGSEYQEPSRSIDESQVTEESGIDASAAQHPGLESPDLKESLQQPTAVSSPHPEPSKKQVRESDEMSRMLAEIHPTASQGIDTSSFKQQPKVTTSQAVDVEEIVKSRQEQQDPTMKPVHAEITSPSEIMPPPPIPKKLTSSEQSIVVERVSDGSLHRSAQQLPVESTTDHSKPEVIQREDVFTKAPSTGAFAKTESRRNTTEAVPSLPHVKTDLSASLVHSDTMQAPAPYQPSRIKSRSNLTELEGSRQVSATPEPMFNQREMQGNSRTSTTTNRSYVSDHTGDSTLVHEPARFERAMSETTDDSIMPSTGRRDVGRKETDAWRAAISRPYGSLMEHVIRIADVSLLISPSTF